MDDQEERKHMEEQITTMWKVLTSAENGEVLRCTRMSESRKCAVRGWNGKMEQLLPESCLQGFVMTAIRSHAGNGEDWKATLAQRCYRAMGYQSIVGFANHS